MYYAPKSKRPAHDISTDDEDREEYRPRKANQGGSHVSKKVNKSRVAHAVAVAAPLLAPLTHLTLRVNVMGKSVHVPVRQEDTLSVVIANALAAAGQQRKIKVFGISGITPLVKLDKHSFMLIDGWRETWDVVIRARITKNAGYLSEPNVWDCEVIGAPRLEEA